MLNNYQANNIKTLDALEHMRKYPGMYIGSRGSQGLLHCVKELVSNSIDEWLNGSGSTITIKSIGADGLSIEDNARGIPHGKHETGCSILQACFGIANTGGKFDNATGESGYNSSGGEHGTGGKAVNAISRKMIVKTRREGIEEAVEFAKGKFVKYTTNKINKDITGTYVEFYPDPEIMETTEFDKEAIRMMVKEFSFLCKGLTFYVNEEKFYSANGLSDYMNYLNMGKEMLTKPIFFEKSEGKFQLEVAIGYNKSYSSSIKLYTNNIPQFKGTHLTGFKTAWTSNMNTFARENNLLKKKDENLLGSDYDEGMILILNFKMIDPVFKGQNKEELSSSEGRTYCQKLTTEAFKEISLAHKKDLSTIIEKALAARKAREAAKKARETVRGEKKDKKNKLLNLPTKLVDANSCNRLDCELYICEGDSAAGGLIKARNAETQGIFPIRGKMINLYKNSPEKVLANVEVNNLKKALGLDVDLKTGKLIYDTSKLRYGKILTACDADSDGKSIKNLILTCIWTICPELILNGHVYVTVPPLYRITKGKDKYVYIKDDEELEQYKIEHKGEKYVINRNKGLGEQDSEELEPCLLNPATRNINQIIIPDLKQAEILFETFMGTAVPPRRQWLLQHSEEASEGLW